MAASPGSYGHMVVKEGADLSSATVIHATPPPIRPGEEVEVPTTDGSTRRGRLGWLGKKFAEVEYEDGTVEVFRREQLSGTQPKYDQPTAPFLAHLIGLTTGQCVRCGEHTERIRLHPTMPCPNPDIVKREPDRAN
ncbi:MAG TPA: hypothetical protein VEA69_21085 [Tepidisphaeraceae bacterium]|nr:hypothetical protein [Tepidisphaeraceae bacterium]